MYQSLSPAAVRLPAVLPTHLSVSSIFFATFARRWYVILCFAATSCGYAPCAHLAVHPLRCFCLLYALLLTTVHISRYQRAHAPSLVPDVPVWVASLLVVMFFLRVSYSAASRRFPPAAIDVVVLISLGGPSLLPIPALSRLIAPLYMWSSLCLIITGCSFVARFPVWCVSRTYEVNSVDSFLFFCPLRGLVLLPLCSFSCHFILVSTPLEMPLMNVSGCRRIPACERLSSVSCCSARYSVCLGCVQTTVVCLAFFEWLGLRNWLCISSVRTVLRMLKEPEVAMNAGFNISKAFI